MVKKLTKSIKGQQLHHMEKARTLMVFILPGCYMYVLPAPEESGTWECNQGDKAKELHVHVHSKLK